ncbi:MAG: 4-hydroxy-3-methylbut-2-en-1-yl diphosphate synthase [Blautia sp.]|nr:4-hydroxy-3-methylbut-2-en-1-yl diphosphate synthase [Blautia sp.]
MNEIQNKAELIRQKFRNHELVMGAHVFYNDPAITETFGYMGFDYVWIDGEHCAFDKQSLLNHVVGAYAGGTASLVRVEWNDPVLIKPILEMGIDAILVPMVCTREEAIAFVKACRYPLGGVRGFGPRRSNQYGALSNDVYLENVERSFLRILQIEHAKAVENLEEIIQVEGIDAVIVGPNDLSASYGHLGDVTNPEMQEIYDRIAYICKKGNMPFGVSLGPGNKEFITEWIQRGVSLISCTDDISCINMGSRDMLQFLKSVNADE